MHPPPSGRENRLVLGWRAANIVLARIAIGLPFLAFSRLILFHFYTRGAFLLDTGLLASMLWHGDALVTQPAALGGGSFFATHVSPLFLLVLAVSWMTPLTMPVFFAGFTGLCHALLAYSYCVTILLCHKLRISFRRWQHGQRGTVLARTRAIRIRTVAMEIRTWRSARSGGPGSVTAGQGRFREESGPASG